MLEDATEAVRDHTRRNHSLENACAKLFEIDQKDSDEAGIRASVFAHACDIIHLDLHVHEKEIPFLNTSTRSSASAQQRQIRSKTLSS
ncbi:MAG: hypothetical protein IPG56_19475 [Caulobacteraceae bacterium]|nr:hypothetical protein [Caulobacteraceae bacterium]